LIWDATCVSTFAASHLPATVARAGAAAEAAAGRKRLKYSNFLANYWFVPVAVEVTGVICDEANTFLNEIGRRLRNRGQDPRSGAFLRQRLSIAVQRGNASSIMGTFGAGRMGL